VNKSTSNDNFCFFKKLSFLCFSVCGTSYIKQNDKRLVSAVTLSASKCRPVLIIFHSFLKKIRKHMLKKVRTMLGINIRYIFQDSIKVAECLFLEIFREEKI